VRRRWATAGARACARATGDGPGAGGGGGGRQQLYTHPASPSPPSFPGRGAAGASISPEDAGRGCPTRLSTTHPHTPLVHRSCAPRRSAAPALPSSRTPVFAPAASHVRTKPHPDAHARQTRACAHWGRPTPDCPTIGAHTHAPRSRAHTHTPRSRAPRHGSVAVAPDAVLSSIVAVPPNAVLLSVVAVPPDTAPYPTQGCPADRACTKTCMKTPVFISF
jgi:hypothetical protein